MLNRIDTRPTVLLTGFGPFPGVPENASARLVRKVVRLARRRFPEFRFVAAVLPTEWRRAPRRIEALHDRYRPILALHFGVASQTQSIRIETRAENGCRASLDAANLLPPAATLCANGPEARHVTIDTGVITDALKARGWPCTISNDAGGYLCNAILYHSLASAEARGGAKVGFIHIPGDPRLPPLMMEELAAAAIEIVRVALGCASATATTPV